MRIRSAAVLLLVALILPTGTAHSVGSSTDQAPAAPDVSLVHADGVSPHEGLDGVYARFTRAYHELDSATMGALYTEDALYLPAGGPMQRGRGEIEAGFRRFFDWVRADGARLAIGFEILDRQVSDGLATDVGIYTLRRIGADGEAGPADRGKFTVVALRGDDGAWRFHVDGFSPVDGLQPPPAPPADPTAAMGDLEIRELRPGVWLHVSRHEYPDGSTYPSNGLAVADGESSLVLVDTAWGEVATVNLVRRLEEVTGREVTRAVSTHFHYDRVAGADVLAEMGVETLAHPRTIPLANRLGGPTPRNAVEALAAPGGHATVGPVELFYPGAGHAEDNLVVWVPAAKVLFGGCAVREAATSTAGNTADADLASWPEAIRRVRARYPEAEVVVPGHGEPGGAELLDHSIAVLETAPP